MEYTDKTILVEVNNVLSDHQETALNKFVWLMRLEKWAKDTRETIKEKANADFQVMRKAQPSLKTWQPVPFALVNMQPPRTVYEYPADILEKEADIRALKAAAKANGKAMPVIKEQNPAKDQLFRVSLIDSECHT